MCDVRAPQGAREEDGAPDHDCQEQSVGKGLPLARRAVELAPGAKSLLAWCEQHGVPFRVLSDGFDANLNRIQRNWKDDQFLVLALDTGIVQPPDQFFREGCEMENRLNLGDLGAATDEIGCGP